jgi:TIR domain
MGQQYPRRVLFYSYDSSNDSDQTLQKELACALRQLVRDEHLDEWSDRQILAGTATDKERRQALESATLILLLLSHSYLASDRCYQEMEKALERRQQGKVHVIPILLSPCDWQHTTSLASLSPLPKKGLPVTTSTNQAQAFLEIAQEIRRVVGTYPSQSSQMFLSSVLDAPVSTSVPSSMTRLPHIHIPIIVVGFILLILMILGGSIYIHGVVAGNWLGHASHGQSTIQASATARTQDTGRIWLTQTSGTSQHLAGVAWSGSQWVTVGTGITILTSPDGHAWVAQSSGTSQHLYGVAWSDSRSQWVAVGNNGIILTSSDGRIWTVQHSGTSQLLEGIAWSGSQWVAVGDNGIILTSSDGRIWTAQHSGTLHHLQGVVWSGSQFVIVGRVGTILTSP